MTTPAAIAMRRYRAKPGVLERQAMQRKQPGRRDKEYATTRARRCDLATWPASIIKNIRHRAKKNGRRCSIVAADILVPEFCPVLGIKLVVSVTGKPLPNSPSVDRFYNDAGYTPDNIRVISHRANQLKRDATVEELERVLHYMKVTGVP